MPRRNSKGQFVKSKAKKGGRKRKRKASGWGF
jgi:hypothetical protein